MKGIRMFKLLCLLIAFAVIMDFVPIKMAKKLKNIKCNDEIYVCKYVTATDGNWLTENLYNSNISSSIYLNVEGKTAFNSLKEMLDASLGCPVLNMYMFQGKIEKREVYEDVSLNWLQIKKWDIIYPVKRQSFRAIYVPKSYLTIYDFNWINMMCQIFK